MLWEVIHERLTVDASQSFKIEAYHGEYAWSEFLASGLSRKEIPSYCRENGYVRIAEMLEGLSQPADSDKDKRKLG
jgi:hypothetical protein